MALSSWEVVNAVFDDGEKKKMFGSMRNVRVAQMNVEVRAFMRKCEGVKCNGEEEEET